MQWTVQTSCEKKNTCHYSFDILEINVNGMYHDMDHIIF